MTIIFVTSSTHEGKGMLYGHAVTQLHNEACKQVSTISHGGGGGLVLDLMKLDKIEQVVFFVQKMKSEGWT